MEKTEKCYHYFIVLSILFGVLFCSVSVRLQSGFQSASEIKFFNFLTNCQYPLLVGFVLSTSITIVIKSILDDLEWTLAGLKCETENLSKKISEFQKDK